MSNKLHALHDCTIKLICQGSGMTESAKKITNLHLQIYC